MSKKKQLVFFLRAYNDLDHITPIIYQCKKDFIDVTIKVVLTAKPSLIEDYRIVFLKEIGVNAISHISKFDDNFFQKALTTLKHGQFLTYLKDNFNKFLDRLNIFPYSHHSPNFYFTIIANKICKALNIGENSIVFFDWSTNDFTESIVRASRQLGCQKIIALPHGAASYANRIVSKNNISLENYFSGIKKQLKLFDLIIYPSDYFIEQTHGPYREKHVLSLGSPRFNNAWIKIYEEQFKHLYQLKVPKDKVNIALFLRGGGYSIFEFELLKVIEIIASFSEVNLIIKAHTRLSNMLKARKFFRFTFNNHLKEYPNVQFVFDDVISSDIIRNSDLIIDMGTSAILEAIVKHKNLMAIEYLYPNTTGTAFLFPNTIVNNREELFQKIEMLVKDKKKMFYTVEERKAALNLRINKEDSNNVLPNYSKLFKKLLNAEEIHLHKTHKYETSERE